MTVTTLAAAGDVRMMRSGALRAAPPRAAPVAHVFRVVYCGRIFFFDPRARRKDPSRGIYDPTMRALPGKDARRCLQEIRREERPCASVPGHFGTRLLGDGATFEQVADIDGANV